PLSSSSSANGTPTISRTLTAKPMPNCFALIMRRQQFRRKPMPVAKGNIPWNSGSGQGWTDSRGYRWLYLSVNGKRVARREHRVIMERQLGHTLKPWQLPPHRDGNKPNNHPTTPALTEFGKPTADHSRGRRHAAESRRSME